MAITIKNDAQLDIMRKAGRILAKTFEQVEKYIKPGVTTGELDKIAEEYILSNDSKASFLGYRGFPKSICISVNDEVIHGIPGLKKLNEGDIVSIDIGVYYNSFHSDAARTYPVGRISDSSQRLIDVTRQSFFEGLKFAREGVRLQELCGAIQDYVENNNFSVVREFIGHGIGKDLHEGPEIPNFRPKSKGPLLKKNMTLAVEPMVNAGTYEVYMLKDKWTIVTKDHKQSAHYENTFLVTDGEPEIFSI